MAIVFRDYLNINLDTRTQTTDGIDMGYQPMVCGLQEHSEAQWQHCCTVSGITSSHAVARTRPSVLRNPGLKLTWVPS